MNSRKVNNALMGKSNSKACCSHENPNLSDLSTVLRTFKWTAVWKIDHWTHLSGSNTSELTSKVFYPEMGYSRYRFALSCYPQYQNEDGPLMSLDFKLKSLGKIKYHGPEELPDGHFHFYASGTPFVCYKNGKIIDCRNDDGSRKTFNLKNFDDVTFRLSGSLPKTLQVGFYITIVEAITD